jgi:hypothetical protein
MGWTVATKLFTFNEKIKPPDNIVRNDQNPHGEGRYCQFIRIAMGPRGICALMTVCHWKFGEIEMNGHNSKKFKIYGKATDLPT